MYHIKVRDECVKYMFANRQDYEKVTVVWVFEAFKNSNKT